MHHVAAELNNLQFSKVCRSFKAFCTTEGRSLSGVSRSLAVRHQLSSLLEIRAPGNSGNRRPRASGRSSGCKAASTPGAPFLHLHGPSASLGVILFLGVLFSQAEVAVKDHGEAASAFLEAILSECPSEFNSLTRIMVKNARFVSASRPSWHDSW